LYGLGADAVHGLLRDGGRAERQPDAELQQQHQRGDGGGERELRGRRQPCGQQQRGGLRDQQGLLVGGGELPGDGPALHGGGADAVHRLLRDGGQAERQSHAELQQQRQRGDGVGERELRGRRQPREQQRRGELSDQQGLLVGGGELPGDGPALHGGGADAEYRFLRDGGRAERQSHAELQQQRQRGDGVGERELRGRRQPREQQQRGELRDQQGLLVGGGELPGDGPALHGGGADAVHRLLRDGGRAERQSHAELQQQRQRGDGVGERELRGRRQPREQQQRGELRDQQGLLVGGGELPGDGPALHGGGAGAVY